MELGSHGEMNTSEMIDRMFEGVLDITVEEEEHEDEGVGDCCDPQLGKEGNEGGKKVKEEEESKPLDTSLDEMLTIPPSCVLSPLSSSMEVVVTSLVRSHSAFPVLSTCGFGYLRSVCGHNPDFLTSYPAETCFQTPA